MRFHHVAALLLARVSIAVVFAQPTDAKALRNISARSQLVAPGQPAITGFVIDGSQPKLLLLRASGSSLANFGVTNPVRDPVLRLFAGSGRLVAENARWASTPNIDELRPRLGSMGVQAFGVMDSDSALLLALPPGAYSAHVTGSPGVVLLEIYGEAQTTSNARLVNLSTLVHVEPGEGNAIVGLWKITGRRYLIRAVGPGLRQFGVRDFIPDPIIEIVQPPVAGGTRLSPVVFEAVTAASNDDWHVDAVQSAPGIVPYVGTPEEVRRTARSAGAFPLSEGSKDAAMVVEFGNGGAPRAPLPSQTLTLRVRDVQDRSGVVLIEVYDLGDPEP